MLIGLFAFSATAQKSNEVELIVGGIKNGTAYSTIIKKIGNPQTEDDTGLNECTQGQGKKLVYDGLEINVEKGENDNNYTLLDMKITSAKWLTDKGIKVGATPNQVTAKYGKTKYENVPDDSAGEKRLLYEMKNGPGTAAFFFENDRLVRIELNPTIC
jgi:hypothetical protein